MELDEPVVSPEDDHERGSEELYDGPYYQMSMITRKIGRRTHRKSPSRYTRGASRQVSHVV
jgi:hypothetical protein